MPPRDVADFLMPAADRRMISEYLKTDFNVAWARDRILSGNTTQIAKLLCEYLVIIVFLSRI